MKLIYIANARIPTEKAHGLQIMKMCEAFSGLDVQGPKLEIELVVPRRFNYIKESSFEYYGVKRNFEIKRLPCLDLIPLDKYIGHLGLWIESITFLISTFFYLLTSNIKHQTSNIIYTRDYSLLPLILLKKNLFFEVHTFPKNYFLYSPYLKRLKKIIVITQKLKELFVKKRIPEERILVAPDGVDLQEFDIKDNREECRKRLNLPLDKKIVLYTGHLYGWKGTQILAEASKLFPEDTEVYFVGGTEKHIKEFRLWTSDLKLNIVGHRPHSEIPYWLRAADVLILPNSTKADISRYWTSPIKMFEYMVSKRPIVASNLPSIREILNEKNAILVEPDNPEGLTNGIKKILQNPELSAKISNQAFEDVQDYTWQKRVKKILKFIK